MNYIVLYKPEAVEIIRNWDKTYRGEDIVVIPGGYAVYLIADTFLDAYTKANGLVTKFKERY